MPFVPYAEDNTAIITVSQFAAEIERTLLLRQGRVYYTGAINESGVHLLVGQLEFAADQANRLLGAPRPEKDEARAIYQVDPDLYHRRTVNRLELVLDTAGGSVRSGLALIEHMHRISLDHGLPIDVRVTGRGYSMGTVILQGAPGRRIIGPLTTLHYHALTMVSESGKLAKRHKLHPDDEKQARDLETMICGLFASRNTSSDPSYHDPELWRQRLYGTDRVGRDTYLNSYEALATGLVDQVESISWSRHVN